MQATTATKQLRENPFQAYRDPHTGKWLVIHNRKLHGDRTFDNPNSVYSQPISSGTASQASSALETVGNELEARTP